MGSGLGCVGGGVVSWLNRLGEAGAAAEGESCGVTSRLYAYGEHGGSSSCICPARIIPSDSDNFCTGIC